MGLKGAFLAGVGEEWDARKARTKVLDKREPNAVD
jgi:hypothetical protein